MIGGPCEQEIDQFVTRSSVNSGEAERELLYIFARDAFNT